MPESHGNAKPTLKGKTGSAIVAWKLAMKMERAISDFADFADEYDPMPESDGLLGELLELNAEKISENIGEIGKWCVKTVERIHYRTRRYSHHKDFKLRSAIRNINDDIQNLIKYGTTVDLLDSSEVDDVRSGNVQYGSTERIEAKRSAVCRCCAEKIKKGEKAIEFYWDFQGCGSWTAVRGLIHESPCEPKIIR